MEEQLKAFAELEAAAAVFKAAIFKFQNAYNPDTVGLTEWVEDIDTVLFDIKEDMNAE